MARPTRILIEALRTSADRIERGAEYSWTHMGSCNCGHLVQSLTHRSKAEIHRMALQKAGDWGQQAVDHCPVSGYPIDHIITTMIEAGMTHQDIYELERLANRDVLAALPAGHRRLDYRERDDVVVYMRAWAEYLEQRLTPSEIDDLVRDGQIRTADAQTASTPTTVLGR
ncbi:MAG: hypothetical protein AAFN74_01210 [Myxococcota bacterium]